MAHNVEPMDIDNIESDFDNKENSIHHSNVYPRTPCTEKGYEELDVSELNMKLRYSITPAASPMSRSYTANCPDTRGLEQGDDTLNANLTRSLHSAFSKGDGLNKAVKTLPLQTISTEQLVESNRNASVLRQLDSTVVVDNNVTVTITQPSDIDENISFPSSSSSTAQTPEATTPTKEIPRDDGGSPIMRGLKSVLNMFRSSQSPIPPADNTDVVGKQVLSPADILTSTPDNSQTTPVLASTPIATYKHKEGHPSKRNSPHKESLVFNEDLEKELLWKDETTILFSQEKIPIHKLFFQQAPSLKDSENNENHTVEDKMDCTVEYMDISYNNSMVKNKTITDLQTEGLIESDNEFVDCETTFTNDSSRVKENKPINTTEIMSATSDIPINDESTAQLESQKAELPGCDDKRILSEEKEPVLETSKSISEEVRNDIPVNVNEEDIIKPEDTTQNSNITVTSINNQNNDDSSTQDGLHTSVSKVSDSSETNIPPLNMTFETRQQPAEEIILKTESDTVNSTVLLSESVVINTQLAPSQEHVSNASFVYPIDCLPIGSDVINTTYNTKCDDVTFVKHTETEQCNDNHVATDVRAENMTFVKENESVSLSSDNINVTCDKINATATIVPQVEDTTFVKEIERIPDSSDMTYVTEPTKTENETFIKEAGNATLPSDNSCATNTANIEDMTFVKQSETVPVDCNKTCNVGYNSFVQDIKTDTKVEDKVNTSTPSTELDNPDSPANIPLPDEDDIENEKSLGTSMLVEEQTIPVDINNISATKLEDVRNVEEMPMHMAKSIDLNNLVNRPIGEKELITIINSDSKFENSGSPDTNMNQISDSNIVPDVKLVEDNEFKSDILPQDISMNGEQQSILAERRMQHNLDISMEEVPHVVDTIKDVEQVIKTPENTGVSEENNVIKNMPAEIIPENASLDTNNAVSNAPADARNNPICEVSNTVDLQKQDLLEIKSDITSNPDVVLEDNAFIVDIPEAEISTTLEQTPINDTVTTKNTSDSLLSDEVIAEKILPLNELVTPVDCPENQEFKESIKVIDTINNDVLSTNTHIEKEEIVADSLVEEVVVSENNSPFVSVAGHMEPTPVPPINFDEIENPSATKSRVVVTPPASPKIVSKGYNFNFDEIDDPFATKTKIRLSPTPETSPKGKTIEEKTEAPQRDINKNRRKSQPERKKPLAPKKKLNSTFSGAIKTTKSTDRKLETLKDIELNPKDATICKENENFELSVNNAEISELVSQKNDVDINTTVDVVPKSEKTESLVNEVSKEEKSLDDRDVDTTSEAIVENISSIDSLNAVLNEPKTTSSSDTFYSAGTSSGEGSVHKNVFNIPEIDDMNFNPFVTKSKMRQSPPPGAEDITRHIPDFIEPAITDVKKVNIGIENKSADVPDDKEIADVNNTTCSSKGTDDKDVTIREIHTEDEDTEEGPFLEADDNDKMSDFDGEGVDMMQFSELPPQNNEDNAESGEMFIDAEAFEFLLNQNKSNVVSDSGKESLFLKFDPLFAKRASTDGMLAALQKVQKRQSTPKKIPPQVEMDSTFAVAGPSTLNETREVEPNIADESTEDLNVTVSKPMMVVTPAVNPIVTPRNKTTTPTSSNRRSITFTSPAIAVIDRLLSLSANNSLLGHDTTVTVSREQSEAEQALTQLRELLAEKEINVYNLRSETKELKDRLTSLESQMRTLETESEGRLRKVNELNEKLTEKTKINRSMAAVVEEYERTIASLIAETEQDKKRHNEERIKLIKERDEQTAHLASMEVSFSDLHSKYEKSKQIILTCKANEDSYKKSIKEFEENLSKMQSNYELLKQHATSKLNHANQELEKMNRAHESEVLKLNAMIKRKELHITSLEETLTQKTKANEELTAICDELINKVG